jgi:hypothetical protein
MDRGHAARRDRADNLVAADANSHGR